MRLTKVCWDLFEIINCKDVEHLFSKDVKISTDYHHYNDCIKIYKYKEYTIRIAEKFISFTSHTTQRKFTYSYNNYIKNDYISNLKEVMKKHNKYFRKDKLKIILK